MWCRDQNIAYNLLWEVTLRVFIMGLVCVVHIKVPPRMSHITETELLNLYKRPRHESYVPSWAIAILVVFVPLFFIYMVFTITKSYVDSIQAMLAWTLALSITAVMTESLKLIVGRPRPDLFYRCFPQGDMSSGLQCNGNMREVLEGFKSFPSGHSSFSFCSFGFLSIWMFGKIDAVSMQRGKIGKALACAVPLILAGIVAISRYYDNHHHWGDIFVGSVLGLAASHFCYHRYYYPMESTLSGVPLTTMSEDDLFHSYYMECCSGDLSEEMLLLHLNKYSNTERDNSLMVD